MSVCMYFFLSSKTLNLQKKICTNAMSHTLMNYLAKYDYLNISMYFL